MVGEKMPKISVIVPVYKVEPYLHRCVDSIINQTYQNLEIILVEDGSPDNCPQICDEYAQQDSRIKVIHQENNGLSAARNAGLDIATGNYIAFVDSDDYIDPDMYETMLNIMSEHNADIVECGYRWVKPDITYDRENTKKIDIYTPLKALDALYFGDQMFGGISIVVWNKLYKADLLKNLRMVEGYIHEDVEFTPKVLYSAEKIVKYNYNFYNFYFSANSISRSTYSLKNAKSIEMHRRVPRFFKDKGGEYIYIYKHTYSLYRGALFNHFYECTRRKNDPAFLALSKSFQEEISSTQTDALEILATPPSWKERLFIFSPRLWCFAVSTVRNAREIKWKMKKYVKLLKRNP